MSLVGEFSKTGAWTKIHKTCKSWHVTLSHRSIHWISLHSMLSSGFVLMSIKRDRERSNSNFIFFNRRSVLLLKNMWSLKVVLGYLKLYTGIQRKRNYLLSTSQILEAEGCWENKLTHVSGALSVLNNVTEMPIWKLVSLNILKLE